LAISAQPRPWTLRHSSSTIIKDDVFHHGMHRKEGDNLHSARAIRADHRIHFIDLPDHGRPTFRRKVLEFLLNHPEFQGTKTRLLDLSPMAVPVEAIIPQGDRALSVIWEVTRAMNSRESIRSTSYGFYPCWS